MTLRHLKIFLAVVDYNGMRKAAEFLSVSQPAVTQAIRELETHYNTRLFDRIAQKLYITPSGDRLIPYARQILELFSDMDQMMQNNTQEQQLRIGASVSVGTTLLNEVLDLYETQFGPLDAEVVINNTMTIEQMLRDCKLDVGIVEGIVDEADMVRYPILKDELVLIVGAKHPFYQRECIALEELRDALWISREEESVVRNQYEQLLAERQIPVKKAWSCTNTEAIKNAVIHNRGIAVISRLLIDQEIKENKVKALKVSDCTVYRDIQVIHHKDKYLTAPLQRLIHLCIGTE